MKKNRFEKLEELKSYLKSLGSVAVAFSSGVDSTLLLDVAHEVLQDNVIAVTAMSESFPERELNESIEFCQKNHIKHYLIYSDELDIPGFRENPKNRCYLCKKELFSDIADIAKKHSVQYVVEGSNMDDLGDYRPGLIAIKELGIKSPLRQVELNKAEIRALSKDRGLPTFNKPSFACLASRFVYGELIDEKKLEMVGKGEQYLLDKGFYQLRVRIHKNIARIEVAPDEIHRFFDETLRNDIYNYFKSIGFQYVTLDLQGYRTGSMNETLTEEERNIKSQLS